MTPEQIIKAAKLPTHECVYSLCPVGGHLSFAAQQNRALNLVWALHLKELDDKKPRKVAVIGAGVAGTTASCALLSFGHRVTLLESGIAPLHLQGAAAHRTIYPAASAAPNLPSQLTTAFPFLNWHADCCPNVLGMMRTEFKTITSHYGDKYRFMQNCNVVDFVGDRAPYKVQMKGGSEAGGFDVLIFAIGFDAEEGSCGFESVGYWDYDNDKIRKHYSDESKGDTPRLLVSGCGDGGLIDALRAVFDFHADKAHIRQLLIARELEKLVEKIEVDENKNRFDFENVESVNRWIRAVLARLGSPNGKLIRALKDFQIKDKRFKTPLIFDKSAIDEGHGELKGRASVFNKFLAYFAKSQNDLDFARGVLAAPKTSGTTAAAIEHFDVDMEGRKTELRTPYSSKDSVPIIRHGSGTKFKPWIEKATNRVLSTSEAKKKIGEWFSKDRSVLDKFNSGALWDGHDWERPWRATRLKTTSSSLGSGPSVYLHEEILSAIGVVTKKRNSQIYLVHRSKGVELRTDYQFWYKPERVYGFPMKIESPVDLANPANAGFGKES